MKISDLWADPYLEPMVCQCCGCQEKQLIRIARKTDGKMVESWACPDCAGV